MFTFQCYSFPDGARLLSRSTSPLCHSVFSSNTRRLLCKSSYLCFKTIHLRCQYVQGLDVHVGSGRRVCFATSVSLRRSGSCQRCALLPGTQPTTSAWSDLNSAKLFSDNCITWRRSFWSGVLCSLITQTDKSVCFWNTSYYSHNMFPQKHHEPGLWTFTIQAGERGAAARLFGRACTCVHENRIQRELRSRSRCHRMFCVFVCFP